MSNEYTVPSKDPISAEQEAIDAGIDIDAIDASQSEQSPEKRPSWLPSKFKTPEDFAKSYSELEKRMKAPKVQAEEVEEVEEVEVAEDDEVEIDTDTDTEAETDDEDETEDELKDKAEKAGIDFDTLRDQFWTEGNGEDLPESAYEELEKAGIRREVAKAHVEGQKAIIALERINLLAPIGGEDAYAEISQWAADNLSEKDLEKYNEAVSDADLKTAQKAVQRLKARYDEANGSEPKRKVAGRAAAPTVRKYDSMAQVVADMNNPLYRKDPAYRAKVDAKLARSDL